MNQKREIYLLTDKKKFKKIKNQKNYENIKLFNTNELLKILLNLKGKSISIDRSTCSSFNEQIISKLFFIKSNIDPCYKFKSIKNKTEINNMIKAHIEDGIALTKFIYWIKNNRKQLDELNVKKKINFFRNKNKNYLFPSFSPIIGSGPNGAIVHYRAIAGEDRQLRADDILLLDSGAHYECGTTHITRTITTGMPPDGTKTAFTHVLRAHIRLAETKFPESTMGQQLDAIARDHEHVTAERAAAAHGTDLVRVHPNVALHLVGTVGGRGSVVVVAEQVAGPGARRFGRHVHALAESAVARAGASLHAARGSPRG